MKHSGDSHFKKAVPPELPKTVLVEWLDSTSRSGWQPSEPKAFTKEDLVCSTLGYLIHEDANLLSIAATITPDGKNWQHHSPISIPKVAIVKRGPPPRSQGSR